jgi:hypothetical protein
VNFTNVWGRSAHYTFDEAYYIDLDPNCIYYRIHFSDGNLDYEVTGVYKDVEVEIYEAEQPPSPAEQVPLEWWIIAAAAGCAAVAVTTGVVVWSLKK